MPWDGGSAVGRRQAAGLQERARHQVGKARRQLRRMMEWRRQLRWRDGCHEMRRCHGLLGHARARAVSPSLAAEKVIDECEQKQKEKENEDASRHCRCMHLNEMEPSILPFFKIIMDHLMATEFFGIIATHDEIMWMLQLEG